MKVLVLTEHYPPRNSIGAVRVSAFVKDLTHRGWDVRVLTLEAPESITEGQDVYRRAPSKLGAMLSSVDHGAGRANGSPSPTRTGAHAGFALGAWLRRPAAWVFRNVVAVPDREVFSWLPRSANAPLLGTWRPDVLLASGPPFSIFLTARSLARELGIPWVADYRDLWTNGGYYPHGPLRRRIDRLLEMRVLKSAAAAMTVSEPLANDLKNLRQLPVACVMNGFENLNGSEPAQGDRELLIIRYTGEIYPGRRDPSPLFEAIASLGPASRRIRVEFYGQTVDPIRELAGVYGLHDIVLASPRVPHDVAEMLQASADVLLLLMWDDPREAGVYSGKIMEYVGARRPILMLGYDGGVAANLIRERNLGVVSNDVASLKGALMTWLEAKTKGPIANSPIASTLGLSRSEQNRRVAEVMELVHSGAGCVDD